jgi:NADH-quinone oxidoreductase subunit C
VERVSALDENIRVVERLTEAIGKENVIEAKTPRARRAFIRIKVEKLREAVTYLKEKEGITHLSTITGLDLGEEREIVYHFGAKNLALSVKVRVPASDPKVPSITDIINGATLYEREVYDLVGVYPEGHPDPKRLLLSEDWPEGVHPLLKTWDVNSLRKRVDGKEW